MDFAQTCIGTPYYMSPEIFQNKPYSYKSDVWALGCVLYEMTTLNHAFDANSLNGLAGKIVKGRYPPIHHKYSKFLRDLIAQMLLINPQQRPDLDQILRKPFIKKHIVNFFADIAARPSVGLGEGTMIVRAAAGAPINGAFHNDTNMLSLQKQLHVLDMTEAVQEALAPRDVPADSLEAKKLVKEQAGALRREKEHKLMVESALEKLRLERESRTRQRSNPSSGAAISPQPSAASAYRAQQQPGQYGDPKGGAPLPSARREDPLRPAAARQPQAQGQAPVRRPSDAVFQPSVEAARKEVRDRFAVGGGGGGGSAARSGDQDKDKPKRNPSVSEERRILDERKRIEQEEKRKDEVRYEARIREEARVREDSRVRGEVAAKQKLDQLRAQVDAVARRDQQREKERMRQKEEIEQLKRDKVELDRRSNERDRLREERREEERKKLEDGRRQQLDAMQEKSVPYSRDNADYRSGQRAEEKESGSSVSAIAREKAMQVQRREKQARDEADRAEAIRAARVAEDDNRRSRAAANSKMYPDSANYPVNAAGNDRGEERSKRAGDRDITLSVEELTQRLNDVTKGRNTRYHT
jgi:NIMA (never in mitosis gene a)-related kinase 1/4/5